MSSVRASSSTEDCRCDGIVMRTAFLFPGQASGIVGMPSEWSRRSAHVRHLLDEASRRCGEPLSRIVSAAALARTSLFQPVLTALCAGIARELIGKGIRPDVVAGHSLGELAACATAGAMRAEDAVGVAVTRGRLMEREAARRPGGMLALAPCDRATAEDAVLAGCSKGMASLAAHNAADRWVVAGEWAALQEIESRTSATRLAVAGPWHSPMMATAVTEYRDALRAAVTLPMSVPIVCNRSGGIVDDAAALVELLAGQLTHYVRWADSMALLRSSGVTSVVVCGPGKALRHFVREGIPGADMHTVEWPDDLARAERVLAT
jgi:[acyl-carrier-protein] S-malonyltransferase